MKLTQLQIVQIKKKLKWLQSEVMLAYENALALGNPVVDDRQYLGLINIELYNAECAAERTRAIVKKIIASLEESE